ncbi:MAG: hypothetical protein ABJ056_04820 [Halioglobus sp.]
MSASTPEFDDGSPFVDEELDESPVVNPAEAQSRALAQMDGSKRNSTQMSQGPCLALAIESKRNNSEMIQGRCAQMEQSDSVQLDRKRNSAEPEHPAKAHPIGRLSDPASDHG